MLINLEYADGVRRQSRRLSEVRLRLVNLDSLTLTVVAVFFGATLLRSALGFGEALIAVPLLAFALPVTVAAPVAVLLSITVAAVVVAQDWRHVHLRSAVHLVLSTLAGIPLGLLLLRTVPEPVVKAVLGVLVAGFAGYALRRRSSYELTDDRHAWPFGLSAGVLGGAYGMNGPPFWSSTAHCAAGRPNTSARRCRDTFCRRA